MNKMLIVAGHELKSAVMTKGFWIGLLVVPLMIALTTALPALMQRQQPPTVYAIIDQSRNVAQPIVEILNRRAPQFAQSNPPPPAVRVPAPHEIDIDQDPTALVDALRPYFRGEIKVPTDAGPRTLSVAIVVPSGFGVSATPVQIVSVNPVPEFASQVRNALTQVLRSRALEARGLDPQLVMQIQGIVAPVLTVNPDQQNRQRDTQGDIVRLIGPFALSFLLVMSAFTGGARLLNSMVEERGNKLVEVILSSISVDHLMIGKLLGNAVIGLVIVVVWVGTGLALARTAGTGSEIMDDLSKLLTVETVVAFLLYFLAAYVMYSALFLAVGSLVDSVQDAQAYMMPLTLITMLPMFLIMPVIRNPESSIAVVLSWIPLYTPIGMMMRLPLNPPLWEIVGTTALMLAFIALLIWALARLLRVSVLSAGGSIRGAQLWRVLSGKSL